MTGIWLGQVELSRSLAAEPVTRPVSSSDTEARVLVRVHSQPLGYATIPIGGAAPRPDAVGEAASTQLSGALNDHLARDGLEPTLPLPDGPCAHRVTETFADLTVVVCTRERPDLLEDCLRNLQTLEHPRLQVVIVDNAPVTSFTRDEFDRLVGDDPRFRYACEPAPGLSRARNRGLAEARTRWVAFTDDDVRVDPYWLKGLSDGIARDSDAGCVTGIVPPASLDEQSQRYFDRRYSWSGRWTPRVHRFHDPEAGPLHPYSPGIFGTGANFAVDRELMLSIGGFDERLGAGTPTGGGEDLDAFVRVLYAGRTLVVEPSAVVWHIHRGDEEALRKQLFYYGVGLSAFVAKHIADRRTRSAVLSRLPAGTLKAMRMWSPDAIGGKAPRSYKAIEAAGLAWGPVALVQARRWAARTAMRS